MAKKEAPVPAEVKPAAAEKKAAAKKAPAKKAAVKSPMEVTVTLQFENAEWTLSGLEEKAIAAFVAEGHRRGNIKKLSLYVKPAEGKAYYVVNDKLSGSVEL